MQRKSIDSVGFMGSPEDQSSHHKAEFEHVIV